jgi:hypothetical protein
LWGIESTISELINGMMAPADEDTSAIACAAVSRGTSVEGLSRCPRLADMWYRGLAAGTAGTGGGGGEGANSDRIPGEFPKRVELRGIPV